MRIDLHNHTVLCNHATGSVDEYIQRAIELGIGILNTKNFPKTKKEVQNLNFLFSL